MSNYRPYCNPAEEAQNCHQHIAPVAPPQPPYHNHASGPGPCCGGSHPHSYYSPYGYAAHDCRRRRTTYTNKQLNVLEEEYEKDPYMETFKRAELARQMDLVEPQIKVWFQNRRAKDRREGRFIEDRETSPALKPRHQPQRARLVPKSKDSTPRESISPQEDQHLKLELTRPMKHSPPYSQEKPYSPVISQLPANGIPNNFAEYIAVTPVALAMHSANGTLDSDSMNHYQPPNGSVFTTLSAYNVDELGALCTNWVRENNVALPDLKAL